MNQPFPTWQNEYCYIFGAGKEWIDIEIDSRFGGRRPNKRLFEKPQFCVFLFLNLSFASTWVDPGDTSGELYFMTYKNHSKPLGKGHKIK